MTEPNHLKADLLLVLVTLLAAGGWLFSKQALQEMPPLLFLGVRFLLAGLVLGGLGVRALRRLNRGTLLQSALLGVLMAVALLCWIVGLAAAANLGVGAFICSLGVILVPLVGLLLFRMPVPVETWAAVLVATVGMGCLFLERGWQWVPSDGYFLATAGLLAVHFTLTSRLVTQIPVLALTSVQVTVVGVLALSLSALTEPWPGTLSQAALGWLLASALLATSLRFFLQVTAQSLAPLSHAALIMTLEPVWATLIGLFWLGEQMSGLQLAGCGLIFGALLLSRWRWLLRRA